MLGRSYCRTVHYQSHTQFVQVKRGLIVTKSPHTREVANTRILEVNGYGPPLVLVHGLSDSADTWRPLLHRLAAQGRYGVALELPGFGTAPDAQPRKVMPQLEAEVVTAAERATAATGMAPVRVGNSLGAAVALYVAARNPTLTSAVVPVCSAGLYHPAWIRFVATPGLRRDPAAIWRCNRNHLLTAAGRAPHGHNEVIPGCGHPPQLEMPDELLRLIDAFSPLRTDDEDSTFGV